MIADQNSFADRDDGSGDRSDSSAPGGRGAAGGGDPGGHRPRATRPDRAAPHLHTERSGFRTPLGGGDPFDALADLFLGEFGPPRAPAPAARRATHGPHPKPAASTEPPAPIAPTQAPHPRGSHHIAGEADRAVARAAGHSPAWLGATSGPATGPERSAKGASAAVRPAPTVEVVLLGSVPPPASAWLHQYVRFVSRREAAPVALVRAHAGQLRVELHTLDADCPPLPAPRSALEAVSRAVAAAGGGRLLLAVEGLSDAEVLSALPGVELTVLSACDEPSAVAAYRRLKGIASAGAGSAGGPGGESGAAPVGEAGAAGGSLPAELSVRLIAAGCDEASARRLWLRLQDACETFLGAEVILGGHMPRVGVQPGEQRRSALLWDQPCSVPPADLLAAALRPARGAHTGAPAGAASGGGCEPTPEQCLRGQGWRAALEPDEDRAGDIFLAAPGDAPGLGGADDTADVDPPAPGAAVEVGRADDAGLLEEGAADSPPDLAGLLGLFALRARCPAAPTVQLALDDRGGLHCLASSAHGGSIECLTAAGAWARAHTQVLALTTELLVEPRVPVCSHLFTREPAAVRRVLDADLRVHLLAPVPADPRQRFIAVELN